MKILSIILAAIVSALLFRALTKDRLEDMEPEEELGI